MARAAELKGIAAGMGSRFVSRNNDVDGYWAMGKLLQHSRSHGVTLVRIDLLARTIDPHGPGFAQMVDDYAAYLQRRLVAIGALPTWLGSAIVEVDFDQANLPKTVAYLSAGEPFAVCVTLTAATGSSVQATSYGRCHVHDPWRESQSIRAVSR